MTQQSYDALLSIWNSHQPEPSSESTLLYE